MSVVPLRRPAEVEAEVGGALSGSEAEAAHPTPARLFEAIRSGDVSRLPTRRDEAWKYSDLRAAVRALPRSGVARDYTASVGPFARVGSDDVTTILDGRDDDGGALQVAGERVHRLRVVNGPGASAATFDITVAEGGMLTLLESHETEPGGVAALDLTITLEAGACCERIVMVDDAADAVNVATAEVKLTPGASFSQTVVLTGAKLQRCETRCPHPGGASQVRMDAILLLDGSRHADVTTVVEHTGLDGATSQVAKTVAAGRARAVFQGRIVVAQGADGADARMRHDALILSEGAEVDAKPELEIYADDVQCAHGNTVGALDADLLFYIRSRGLPEADAKLLLTQAFVGEVVERIQHEGAREVVAAFVAERLAGLQA